MEVDATDATAVSGAVVTEVYYYDTLVDNLLSLLSKGKNQSKSLSSVIESALNIASQQATESTSESFSISKLTDAIVNKLVMPTTIETIANDEDTMTDTESDTKSPTLALQLVQVLVQINSSLYLPSLVYSVHTIVQKSVKEDLEIHITKPLLNLWMQQLLTNFDSLAVHSQLLDALVMLSVSPKGNKATSTTTVVLSQSMEVLVNIWQPSLESKSKESSILSVRCAELWIQWITKLLGSTTALLSSNHEAHNTPKDLFVQMISNFDDPLQQLTLIDLLVDNFGSTTTTNTPSNDAAAASTKTTTDKSHDVITTHKDDALQEWLSSPELISPILQMLQDSLLSGAALQYLSRVLVSLRPHELDLVLDHIRQRGTIRNETERLQIVQALSNVSILSSGTALPNILHDSKLREAWWDISQLSQSKLQAAILTSVAFALAQFNNYHNLDLNLALTLYNCIGPDNTQKTATTTTTQWLLERFVASPMTELRIAAYALLAAMIQSDVCDKILALHTPKETQSQLLELVMDPNYRESTVDARLAYFDVCQNMYQLLTATTTTTSATSNRRVHNLWVSMMNDEYLHKVTEQLRKKIAMGPHGLEPKRWDVATE